MMGRAFFPVALYEAKNLLRSWFFRIFGTLSLGVLIFADIVLFASPWSPWGVQAVSGSMVYLNILLFNVPQALIGGFLAADFLKYDYRLNTTDVVYIRSMTNAAYVAGKALGLFTVFGLLNVLVLAITLVFNIFFVKVPITPAAYLVYPLLISLPTIIFIAGLSFVLMAVVRSQALTFIILLGYIAATMIFLGNRYNHLFDYMAFNVPFMYSDFIGFGDLTPILLHRAIYFLLGIAGIGATVLILRRLPQSKVATVLTMLVTVGALGGGLCSGFIFTMDIGGGTKLRTAIRELNGRAATLPRVAVTSLDLDLEHQGNGIRCTARLAVENPGESPLDRYIFSLNPGLSVDDVLAADSATWERELHILTVKPASPLAPGAADSLTIVYHGSIDEDACYTDIEEAVRGGNNRMALYTVAKRYAIVTPEYVLLTPEALWYPSSGIPYGADFPRLIGRDFPRTVLRVRTSPGMVPVSQGAVSTEPDGATVFTAEVPVPRLSLAIGRYVKRAVEADSTEFALYTLEGHDYFMKYVGGMESQPLLDIIFNAWNGYETRLGLLYPYKRLSLVETPIQFFTYARLWTQCRETVQPEQVFLPEQGATVQAADFKGLTRAMTRGGRGGGAGGGRGAMTEAEMKSMMIQRFISSVLTMDAEGGTGLPSRGGLGFGNQQIRLNMFLRMSTTQAGNYSLFPQFYTFRYHFSSDRLPMMASVMEQFVATRVASQQPSFFRNIAGLTQEELANMDLDGRSLADLLEHAGEVDTEQAALRQKSAQLLAALREAVGVTEMKAFIDSILVECPLRDTDVSYIEGKFLNEYGFNFETLYRSWLYDIDLPAFVVSDPEAYEIVEGEYTRYYAVFTLANTGTEGGVVQAEFRSSGGYGGFMGLRVARRVDVGGVMTMRDVTASDDLVRYVRVDAGAAKRIGMILEDRPGGLTVNTYVSRNIPSSIEKNITRIEPADGRTVDVIDGTVAVNPEILDAGGIVVDNEDPGFAIAAGRSESLVRRWLNRSALDDGYIGLTFWNLPRRWRLTTMNGFWGTSRLSARYIRAGKGENSVSWTGDLPEAGRYTVFYHIAALQIPGRGGPGGRGGGQIRGGGDQGGRGGGNQGGQGPFGGGEMLGDFYFTIQHQDGSDDVVLDLAAVQEGWIELGTFYFAAGPAVVELSDRSDGRIVYADAVRWSRVADQVGEEQK